MAAITMAAIIVSFLLNNAPRLLGTFLLFFIIIKAYGTIKIYYLTKPSSLSAEAAILYSALRCLSHILVPATLLSTVKPAPER